MRIIQTPVSLGLHQLRNLADGTVNTDAVNKGQLDLKLSLSGGTITGNLVVTGSFRAGSLRADNIVAQGLVKADSSGNIAGGVSIAGTSGYITVSNGDAGSGNPTINIGANVNTLDTSQTISASKIYTVAPSFRQNNIVATTTLGAKVENATAATVSVQGQWSPGFDFIGAGWNTGGTPASNTTRWRIEAQTSGGAFPGNDLVFSSSVDTGTPFWVANLRLDRWGNMNVSQGIYAAGDLFSSAAGSSTSTPRAFGFNSLGSGNATRFQFGDNANSIQSSFGGMVEHCSYWGIKIGGNRQAGAPSYSSGGSSDPSVTIYGTQTTTDILRVDQPASFTGLGINIRNSGGTTIFKVGSAGKVVASAAIVGGVATLTDAATIATDASLGNHFRVTLGGNRTLGNPTNPEDGQRCIWELIQDGTGSRTLTLGSKFLLGTDITAVTLTTTASKRDLLGAVYNQSLDKWLVCMFIKGF